MERVLDFLVTVVDNYGDTGFALDLAESLLSVRSGWKIRFFSDDRAIYDRLTDGRPHPNVEYRDLSEYENVTPSSAIVSFFDRKLPEAHLAAHPFPKKILKVSYLRFDPMLASLNGTRYRLGDDEIVHLVPSPSPGGAGIVVNPKAAGIRAAYAEMERLEARRAFFRDTGRLDRIPDDGILNRTAVSAFFYPESRSKIRKLLEVADDETLMAGFKRIVNRSERKSGFFRPGNGDSSGIGWFFRFLRFDEYETVLSLFDANIVRGENSAAKAMLAGKPFLWDFYKETNGAHREKIEDFLSFLRPFFADSADFSDYSEAVRAFNSEAFSDEGARKCAEMLETPSEGLRKAFSRLATATRKRSFVETALFETEL